jgi:hypothetical protein
MNALPIRTHAPTIPARPSVASTLLRGTLGRVTGWVLVSVVGLGDALGG